MSSIMTDMQKISVSLSERDIAIEPGQTAQLVVSMTNGQNAPDRLTLEVEGVDVEWYAIPVPAVNVAAGAQVSERIIFKLARGSESRAGSYPFLVRVQAMETGEIGVAQATLDVKPFNHLQMELDPKRGVASFFRPLNEFEVTLSNLGNAEETLDLFANDPDDECAYEFDSERITLKPGQTLEIPLAMRPKSSSLLGGGKLFGFTVSARSIEDAYISASAHGQLEKRALISPFTGIFLILLAVASGITYAMWPRPVPPAKILQFNANVREVNAGDDVILSWRTANAKSIRLFQKIKGQDEVALSDQPKAEQDTGNITVKPQGTEETYTIVVSDGQNEKRDMVNIKVRPAPIAPRPKILSLAASPLRVHQGEPVILEWQVSGAEKLILDPGNQVLSSYERTSKVLPDADMKYTLRAVGKDDKSVVEKSVTVSVVSKDACLAEIPSFRLVGTAYLNESVTLAWKTTYARTVHISSDKLGDLGDMPTTYKGAFTVPAPIVETTVFTLTAADSIGKTVTKQLKVEPVVRPPKPVPTPGTTPNGVPVPPDATTPAPPEVTR